MISLQGMADFFNVCFSNPTSPPRCPIGSVLCVPFYTLSSPAFKGVTCGMSFKHTSPLPCYRWYMQLQPGAGSKPIKGIRQLAYFRINTVKTMRKLNRKRKIPLQSNGMAAITKSLKKSETPFITCNLMRLLSK